MAGLQPVVTVSFDPELLEVMPDTVQWSAYTGLDSAGNPTYASQVAVRANVTATRTRGTVGDQEATSGPVVNFHGTIYAVPHTFATRDKITLADGAIGYIDTVTTYRDAPNQGDYISQIEVKEQA